MIRLFFIFFAFLFSGFSNAVTTDYIEKDFDESMCIQDKSLYNLLLRSKYSEGYLDFYRNLYYNNLPSKTAYSKNIKIPKIMHRLWIGSKKMPEIYIKYDDNCKKLHPDWKHILWTEKDIEKLGLENKNFYKDYGKFRGWFAIPAQKDIVLHEVLYRFGGVFMDTDFNCLQRFDELHHKYDLYAGLEPPVAWSKIPVQSMALVGSKPNNPLILKSLQKARSLFQGLQNKDKETLTYCKDIVAEDFICASNDSRFTMMHSLAFTLKHNHKKGDKNIIFPASYFNSLFPRSSVGYSLFDKIFMLDLKLKKDPYCFHSVRKESIAVQDFND